MQFSNVILCLLASYAAADVAVVTQIGDGQIQAATSTPAETTVPATTAPETTAPATTVPEISSYENGAIANKAAFGAAGLAGLAALLM
ncbi:unnamed protein product [Ambrosiozyma monospora]|uniref:Unnamed protein product n=1 Tax=Ambrosiozyma monospora TaxID=43982 RepID=A0ACB5TE25_AMBMO|nr:unnamed protein product [Ambrosiozyma monospora]